MKKLKNLKKNSAALSSLQTKLNAAASSRFVHAFNIQIIDKFEIFRVVRDADSRSMSCSAVISTSTTVVSMVSQNPVSFAIFTIIQTVIKVTIVCTQTEKVALQSVSASVGSAIVQVQSEVTHIQTTLVCKLF